MSSSKFMEKWKTVKIWEAGKHAKNSMLLATEVAFRQAYAKPEEISHETWHIQKIDSEAKEIINLLKSRNLSILTIQDFAFWCLMRC